MSQFRKNIVTKEWVLIAPNSLKRPEQFASRPVMHERSPEHDPACPFCPGKETKSQEILRLPDSENWELRIIGNKVEQYSHHSVSAKEGFLVNRPGISDHEVLISRSHNEPIALQSVHLVESTLKIFKERLRDLSEQKYLSYVQIFHNYGRDAGASFLHPHYQIAGLPFVPEKIMNEIRGASEYFSNNKECVYCEMIKDEQNLHERVVYDGEDFVVLSPYAAASPFELWILPKMHMSNYEMVKDEQLANLAFTLKLMLGQLYAKLSDPAFNLYLHTFPFEQAKNAHSNPHAYHWHFVISPRVAIWGGFEYATNIAVNPVTPESVAKFLR
jgi:UDPglucose--hexose-1-phosphate uridylyltransferase